VSFTGNTATTTGKLWVVKCSEDREDGSTWHWQNYFDGLDDEERTDVPYVFGGDHWIKHAASMRRIRDEVCPGDIVLCYQTNHREILGLTRMHSTGREDVEGSGRFNVFDLEPAEYAHVFDQPIRVVQDLYSCAVHPTCFRVGTHGTLFAVTPSDFSSIIDVIMRKLPTQRHWLEQWLVRAGWRGASRAVSR
jgi:hypothetical protein